MDALGAARVHRRLAKPVDPHRAGARGCRGAADSGRFRRPLCDDAGARQRARGAAPAPAAPAATQRRLRSLPGGRRSGGRAHVCAVVAGRRRRLALGSPRPAEGCARGVVAARPRPGAARGAARSGARAVRAVDLDLALRPSRATAALLALPRSHAPGSRAARPARPPGVPASAATRRRGRGGSALCHGAAWPSLRSGLRAPASVAHLPLSIQGCDPGGARDRAAGRARRTHARLCKKPPLGGGTARRAGLGGQRARGAAVPRSEHHLHPSRARRSRWCWHSPELGSRRGSQGSPC